MKNRKYILKERPRGEVGLQHIEMIEEEVPDIRKGEVIIKTRYISVDPYMRNRMNDVKSYVPPYDLNGLLGGDATGEIVMSKCEEWKVGDLVCGSFGWQVYAKIKGKRLTRIDTSMGDESAWLGILGLTGLTAYFGLLQLGQPSAGETLVISGAAGAVGSIAGQIGKLYGCRVVGIAGSDKKVSYLKDALGFDEAINYKNYPSIRKPLKNLCPSGVDVYFDNVGGEISDGIMYLINDRARIVLCGQIAQYNEGRIPTGPRLNAQLLVHRGRMEGFIVYDFINQFDEARDALSNWYKERKIIAPESIAKSFEMIPHAFLGLFKGENQGKQLVSLI
jgi:NADPH-dependent curcumin reductase CurA